MEPNPWLTFGIAIGGALAALLSGIGSIWALTQKRRYLPKPVMVYSVTLEAIGKGYSAESDSYEEFDQCRYFTVSNRGDGIAHHVELILHAPNGPTSETRHRAKLDVGERIQVSIVESPKTSLEDDQGNHFATTAGLDSRNFWAEFTWREAPNMKRIRRRVLKPRRS